MSTRRRRRSFRRATATALACGACHLMSGEGHPESAGLTGFTAAYLVQQMADFKSGARKDCGAHERDRQGRVGRGIAAGRRVVRARSSRGRGRR